MDFIDSHKTKGKTAIACIGTMQNMTDFSSLCINTDTIITAISSNKEPQPILLQILLKFVSIVNNPDWVCWSKSVGAMPNLHWYCHTFLERIFNYFADFATDFGNGNIMSESRPIAKLNTKALVGALTVKKAFVIKSISTKPPCSPSTFLRASLRSTTSVLGIKLKSVAGLWEANRDPISSLVRAGETSTTLPLLLMQPTTPILPIVRSRRSLRDAQRPTQPPRRGRIWVCFISRIHLSTHPMFFQKSCLGRFAQISPARVRSAAMLHATLSIPGSHLSSNAKLPLQSLTILTKLTLVGLMNTIL
jgi:hypothetical protein